VPRPVGLRDRIIGRENTSAFFRHLQTFTPVLEQELSTQKPNAQFRADSLNLYSFLYLEILNAYSLTSSCRRLPGLLMSRWKSDSSERRPRLFFAHTSLVFPILHEVRPLPPNSQFCPNEEEGRVIKNTAHFPSKNYQSHSYRDLIIVKGS